MPYRAAQRCRRFIALLIYNQGWVKGEAEGKKETAINLLKMGIDVEIINQATGLQEKEIKQLARQRDK
jgi:predicted transposase/invertase (TIGR01784 family)